MARLVGRMSPGGLRDEVVRSRLIDTLDARWSTAITVVEAPAGYGKSTAIRQAVRSNEEDPVGVDYVLACRRFHGSAKVLGDTLLKLLGSQIAHLPDDPQTLADAVVTVVEAHSPTAVCLILDDLHHLGDGDGGVALIRMLLPVLPANLHLVLSGRTLPHLPLTRFRAADQLLRLGPADLAFCEDEVAALASHHNVSAASLQSADGWPALTRLAITVGAVASTEYLLEEVVAGLTPDEARVLAAVIIGRGEDAEWLAGICGVAALRSIAARLPLVSVSASGAVAAHDMWFPALASLVDASVCAEFGGAVARRAAERHAFDEAIDVATQYGAWDAALDAVLGFAMGGESFSGHRRVVSLYERFPASMRAEPELLLLNAISERISGSPGAGAADADRALELFQQRGLPRPIAAAAFEVGYGAWSRGDLSRVLEMYQIARVLVAEGQRFLEPMVSLVEAVAADLRGDAGAAAELLASVDLSSIPTPLAIYVLRDLMSKLQIMGECGRAVAYCDDLRLLTGDSRVEFTIALAHWLNGTPEPVVDGWERLRHRTIEQKHTDFLTWVYSATIDASLGIRSDLNAVPDYTPGRSREEAMRALGRCATFVAAGHEDRAIDELDALEERLGFDDPLVAGELRRQLAVAYVLSEKVRAHIDRASLGPSQLRRLAAARAVFEVRIGGVVDWPSVSSVDDLLTALPLRWSVEVMSAALRDQQPDAASWVVRADQLTDGRVRGELALVAARHEGLAEWAAGLGEILRSSPGRVSFSAFGPLKVLRSDRAGGPEQSTTVSRKRVRQLLGILILQERVAVGEVLRSLWPDLADHEARNNLAATIRLARQIVDAGSADAVRTTRSTSLIIRDETHIRLRPLNHVTSDLWKVRQLLALAVRRRSVGDVKGAMRSISEALQLWTGELLPDLRDLEPFGAACFAAVSEVVTATLDLAEWSLSQGDFSVAEAAARRVLHENCFDERAHAVLIQALLERDESVGVGVAVAAARGALNELGVEPNATLSMILRRTSL